MKFFLLLLTVLIICIAASQSAHVDVRKLKNDVNDLKPSSLLKQEQAPSPTILSCFQCGPEVNETQCTADQVLNQCNNLDDVCAFVDAELFTGQTLFIKGCLDKSFCFNVCQILNVTVPFLFGQLQDCESGCCGSSGCNPVCGGPLLGLSGVFTSPNFPDNYDNLNLCVWTITLATGLTLRVDFTSFELQFCRDFVEFFQGSRLLLNLTGSGAVVGGDDKRSLDNELSRDDECGDDDDENLNGDYGDNYYNDERRRLHAEYFYDDDRRRRVFIRGNGEEIRIVFRSDSSGTRRGFNAQFSVQQAGGGGETDTDGSSDED